MLTSEYPQKGVKNVFHLAKISQNREIVQNWVFDMLLRYNKAII